LAGVKKPLLEPETGDWTSVTLRFMVLFAIAYRKNPSKNTDKNFWRYQKKLSILPVC